MAHARLHAPVHSPPNKGASEPPRAHLLPHPGLHLHRLHAAASRAVLGPQALLSGAPNPTLAFTVEAVTDLEVAPDDPSFVIPYPPALISIDKSMARHTDALLAALRADPNVEAVTPAGRGAVRVAACGKAANAKCSPSFWRPAAERCCGFENL